MENTTKSINEQRAELIQVYSDFHKDAYGFRPRYDYHSYTLEQLEADFDYFAQLCEEKRIAEEKAEAQAIIVFEQRIAQMMSIGANDRQTALKWLYEGEGYVIGAIDSWEQQNIEYFIWCQGIYAFGEGYGIKLLNEITEMITANL